MLNWLCRRVLFSWGILRNPLKRKIINLTNSKIGSEIYYKAGSKIYNTGYFELGDRCFVSRDCSFITGTDAFPDCKIIIGQDVAIGLETSFNCATHEIGSPKRRAGALKMASIIVGDGVWFGTRVTVLAGVTIGSGCIIGAGSIVNKDCEPNCLHAGVPARLIKRLDE